MNDTPITTRREAVVEQLGSAWAEDRIDEAEFERRVSAAFAAREPGELDRLVADLPARAPLVPRLAPPAVTRYPAPTLLRRVVLSSIDERVRDVMPAVVEYGVRLGSLELDFGEAVFHDGVTEILLDVVLGNVKFVLPPDVSVEMRVDGMLSSVEYHNRSRLTQPSHRVVRLTGRCVLGTVEVYTRDPRPGR